MGKGVVFGLIIACCLPFAAILSFAQPAPFYSVSNAPGDAAPLQIIDLYYKNPGELDGYYLYIEDADAAGSFDAIRGSSDTKTLFAVLDPANERLFSNKPNDFKRLEYWIQAESIASLNMADNGVADQRPLLIKRLSHEDAFKTQSGFRIRLMAIAFEGDDLNRFGILLSATPADQNPMHESRFVHLPFLNIDLSLHQALQWTMEGPSQKIGRASFFLDLHGHEAPAFINQLRLDNTSVDLIKSADRLLGILPLQARVKQRYNLDLSKTANKGFIQIRAAQNGESIALQDMISRLKRGNGSNPTPIATPKPAPIRADEKAEQPVKSIERHNADASSPLIADAGINRSTAPDEIIIFDGTLSESKDGRIQSYQWDMGDGVRLQGARIEHRYRESGTYLVRLQVSNESGYRASDSIYVEVNAPPTLIVRPRQGLKQGMNRFEAGQSFDPDGQITRIEWFQGIRKLGEGVMIEAQISQTDIPVKVVATDNSGASNATKEYWIYPAPTASKEPLDTNLAGESGDIDKQKEEESTDSINPPKERIPEEQKVEESSAPPSIKEPIKSQEKAQNGQEESVSVNLPEEPINRGVAFDEQNEVTLVLPESVWAGEDFMAEIAAERAPEQVFWDLGEGLQPGASQLFANFQQVGIHQITAIYFEELENDKSIQRYVNAEIEVLPSRSGRSERVQSQRFKNRSMGKAYSIRVDLTGNVNLGDLFKSNDVPILARAHINTSLQSLEDPETKWHLYSSPCEDRLYTFSEFFGIPDESIQLDQVEVYYNGLFVPKKDWTTKPMLLAKIQQYRIMLKYADEQPIRFESTLRPAAEPIVQAVIPQKLKVFDYYTFNAASTKAPTGEKLRFYWNMGDAKAYLGKTIQHQYVHPGTYEIKLQVKGSAKNSCINTEKRWLVEVLE